MKKDLKKPDAQELYSDLYPKTKGQYNDVLKNFKNDEKYYECDFKELLQLPDEFANEGIVLPTARDMVDTFVDHIDISNARITVSKKGTTKAAEEEAEMMRDFYLGMIYRTNVEADISPWRVGAKQYAKHGLAPIKDVWDTDRYLGKPDREIDESEGDYTVRTDQWRDESQSSLPIVIQTMNPANVMPDPFYGGRLFVFETQSKVCIDIQNRYPKWANPKSKKLSGEVEFVSYWDANFRCEWADGEPLFQLGDGVVKHKYGFIPYVFIDSGLGDMSIDGDLSKRYVGILRYIFDLLIAESRDFSISDCVLKRSAWPWGTIEGEGDTSSVTQVDQMYGTWTKLPKGVKLVPQSPQVPPDALNQHLYRTSDYISAHAAPRSLRGLPETGVRSAAHLRLLSGEGATRYRYSEDAFKHGTAKVLTNCARILKNLAPDDIRVWAKTPTGSIDSIIKKDKVKEPFNCYVEFAPISEEDEYRRHDDLERLVAGGIVTPKWARTQMSNVDPIAMEEEEEMERLKRDPAINQMVSQYAAGRMAQAISKRTMAEGITNLPVVPPMTPGMPPEAPVEAGRGLIPPIPNIPPLGSAGNLQNQMAQNRSQIPMSATQGRGGGGNRP